MIKHLNILKSCFAVVAITLCSSVTFVSCNNFLEVDSNHAASQEQHWNSFEDARAGLMGVYGLMRGALSENNAHYIYGDLRLGDFTVYTRSDLKAITNNELSGQYPILAELTNWRRFYAVINAAAVFIDNAPKITAKDRSYSETNLMYDVAQARALRALAYFYMVRIWGDVPLVTHSYDNGSFPTIARTEAQIVLNYAEGELLNVIGDLPFVYGSSSSNRYYGEEFTYWNGALITKLSAFAILSQIAAWEGNYINLESYTQFIIDNARQGMATLVSIQDLTSSKGLFAPEFSKSVISGGSKLIGFSFSHAYRESTKSGHIEDLTLAYPFTSKAYPEIYADKKTLRAVFDNILDLRVGIDTTTKKYQTNYIADMNAEVPLFSKVKVVRDGSIAGNYSVFGSSLVMSRMEDIYLLHAEALIAQNRGDEATDFYNSVITKRGFSPCSYKKDFNSNAIKLMTAVFDERRREFMGEGYLWYDRIRRTRLLGNDPVMAELIAHEGIYWPIAQDVIRQNSLIKQNDYWK